MGIPHLFRWLKNQDYKGVLRRSVPSYVSSFSFDFNGILHEIAQTVYAYGKGENPKRKKLVEKADPKILEAEYYQALATKLSEVISQVAPQEILVLAVDGVAPQAKIAQQRQRRFRSAMESSENNVFDSSEITPGTEFMKRVDNFLQRWLVSSARSLPPKVIYSSHMVPGEGEHKIISLIRTGAISGDGAHVIYGMDADLIMLSLLAPIENISLMREDISSIIDINSLRLALKKELIIPTSIQDFVVMIFLLGNDFLPHLVSMGDLDEGIETMIRTYKMNNKSLTNSDDLDWQGLTGYLKALAKEEPRLLEL
jgi:5'-3' exoribonuclease 1